MKVKKWHQILSTFLLFSPGVIHVLPTARYKEVHLSICLLYLTRYDPFKFTNVPHKIFSVPKPYRTNSSSLPPHLGFPRPTMDCQVAITSVASCTSSSFGKQGGTSSVLSKYPKRKFNSEAWAGPRDASLAGQLAVAFQVYIQIGGRCGEEEGGKVIPLRSSQWGRYTRNNESWCKGQAKWRSV